ncbi:MAG: WbqC family protein [Flavobacteriaceae bacterium]
MALFTPTYFSPISQYGMLFQSGNVQFEVEDNYQKQTYRNRCYIFGPNGKQRLNIPISHPKIEGRKMTKDVLVEENSNWQSQHYKSLKVAYRNSPFFEFYVDDLYSIFEKKYKYLIDVTIDSFEFINDALDLNKTISLTEEYQDSTEEDYRYLANAKSNQKHTLTPYIQMFDDKYGYLENLSILDLIFMEGPNTISFLEKVNVTLS